MADDVKEEKTIVLSLSLSDNIPLFHHYLSIVYKLEAIMVREGQT